MNTNAHLTPSSATVSAHAAASLTLELREARQAQDALATLLGREQAAMAEFLLALSDFDRRRGWELLGHASLFAFLRHGLGLPNGPAFYRMSAVRLLHRFPEIIEPLRDGRLCLTTVAELAKVLTDENRAEVLPRFFRISTRDAQELVAELMPRPSPPMKTVVTAVERSVVKPSPPLALVEPPETTADTQRPLAALPSSLLAPEVAPANPARGVDRHREVEPLTAELTRLHLTVSRRLVKKLDVAREGLAHAIPRATTEQVLEAALDLLLEKQAKARGQVKRPRKTVATATEASSSTSTTPRNSFPTRREPLYSRNGPPGHIPAVLRRAVWGRDQGRCVWPLDGGGVCGSTHRLEIDHRVPRGLDGETEEDNLRLLCERHNKLAARLAFGERWMGRYAGARGGSTGPSSS
jgi:5-methylcytosine-specific restriction endonuclease McrA